MEADALLQTVTSYCRRAGLAETTFGRLAVNDGKFVSRLRAGGRATPETVGRVTEFMAKSPAPEDAAPPAVTPAENEPPPVDNFRFYNARQKYLMFVHTCSEKLQIANRVAQELPSLAPTPPAIRLFDAGVGDGTVLARVLRTMHHQHERTPFYVVGKEISLEDVRLVLEKMADRFQEHPATVLVLTNMHYAEAPWLKPAKASAKVAWRELALQGSTAAEFDSQIHDLEPFLTEAWRAAISPTSGNPIYETPAVLVIYREDCRFLLDQVIPEPGAARADYDLIIASHPYRARAPLDFKARKVIAPLVRGLAPGGRLIGIHAGGGDPGAEIIQQVWPEETPFTTNRHDLLRAVKLDLGAEAIRYNFSASSDAKALFKHHMHTLPDEIGKRSEAIGASTLFAAWNAATYNAQIDDHRLTKAMTEDAYLRATRDVLRRHGGLWFWDESFVVSRKRDL